MMGADSHEQTSPVSSLIFRQDRIFLHWIAPIVMVLLLIGLFQGEVTLLVAVTVRVALLLAVRRKRNKERTC